MLNKIINELEEAKKYQIPHIEAGIEMAISIIKQHEKEFEQHPISDEATFLQFTLVNAIKFGDDAMEHLFVSLGERLGKFKPLSPEDIERAAELSSEVQEATYTPQHKITYKHGFTDGANFAKQPLANESKYPIEFIMWYSGQPSDKINKAYQRYLNELPHQPKK